MKNELEKGILFQQQIDSINHPHEKQSAKKILFASTLEDAKQYFKLLNTIMKDVSYDDAVMQEEMLVLIKI